ncbi:MAG: hypothetical protein MUD09_07450 [Desulfobacterales bacterium]|nr:hypothetical protein [Desulfobacterales bacterium]
MGIKTIHHTAGEHEFGAFVDTAGQMKNYSYKTSPGKLELLRSDLSMNKTFQIENNKLLVSIENNGIPQFWSISYILDPWTMTSPNWADLYTINKPNGGWDLSVTGTVCTKTRSSPDTELTSFLSPHSLIEKSEDPNKNYTNGYFLPFPLTVIDYIEENPTRIDITVESCPNNETR